MSDKNIRSYPTVIYAEVNNPFEVGRSLATKLAELQEKRIKSALIGSKVTKLEYNAVPDEDDVYELVIGFDAQRIPLLEFSHGFTYEDYAIGIKESSTRFIELSEIRIKTTSKQPFDTSPTTKIGEDEE